jgi:hypothetical protein
MMVRTQWLTEDAMMDAILLLGEAESMKKSLACKESETNEKTAVSVINSGLESALHSVSVSMLSSGLESALASVLV